MYIKVKSPLLLSFSLGGFTVFSVFVSSVQWSISAQWTGSAFRMVIEYIAEWFM